MAKRREKANLKAVRKTPLETEVKEFSPRPLWPQWILLAVPLLIVLWIWLSPLAFVPVPWPDDSAFYFVGREFWKWPPRWVMLPQAPFEPSYRIYNFNTMPLYPILMGFGRLLGIDGSFAIKVWPLGFFAWTASLLAAWTWRRGLPWAASLAIGAVVALDPGMRWASVLARPESLIGFCGMAAVLGMAFGFPKRLQASTFPGWRGLWHPVSALLAIAAYAHFNAVHLLFAAVLTYALALDPRELIRIGLRTAIYLSPWVFTILLKPRLFIQQMTVQFSRLSMWNDWLSTPYKAVHGMFQDMGSPEPWPAYLDAASVALWLIMIAGLVWGVALPLGRAIRELLARRREGRPAFGERTSWFSNKISGLSPAARDWGNETWRPLVPAGGWVLGSIWLWQSKPEVWFNYYVHAAAWAFAGVATVVAWKGSIASAAAKAEGAPAGTEAPMRRQLLLTQAALLSLTLLIGLSFTLFATTDVSQAIRLGASPSWHWETFHSLIDCIDDRLKETEARLGYPKPFRVWCPVYPDITIELSRRHPDWELTRTNDFWDRADLAVQHGRDVEAVAVAEMVNFAEREITGTMAEHPDIQSVWMTWDSHFLNRLWKEPGWKPNRYLCQRARWQGFVFEK